MTNSYNLSLRPKIVFFHGLNNNPTCFGPLVDHFKGLGYETELIILPGHGADRTETKKYEDAIKAFDQSIKRLEGLSYYAIAFSQGALYLQLWLEKNQTHTPIKQVLLAPALFLQRYKVIKILLKILPSSFCFKSLSPKPFRRYEIMNLWEYKTLFKGVSDFQKSRAAFKIPTLVLIDPKDELVNARTLKRELDKWNPHFSVKFYERKYLKKGIARHHILFHPEYYEKDDWKKFTGLIKDFLEK